MKTIIISWLFNYCLFPLYVTFFRFWRILRPSYIQPSSSLILPPSAPGSVGDEAMMNATVSYLKQKDLKKISLISYKSNLEWQGLEKVDETIEMENYFSYDDLRSLKTLLRFLPIASQYERFYCLGADMMDGAYYEAFNCKMLRLVSLAAKMGVNSAVIGFSFNEKPTLASVESLRNLPSTVRLCARDPVSQKRLTYHLNRSIELVADLAFMLKPSVDSEIVLKMCKWINEQHDNGRIVIGINPKNPNLIKPYVNTLNTMFNQNKQLSFILIPHDFREYKGVSDVVLSDTILNEINPEIQPYCIRVPTPCKAAEIKAIVANLDLVLSGRMHLAIACLGQGTPAACITYQGKFEGLFEHFELEGMTIEPETLFKNGTLMNFLIPLIDHREEIRQHIQSKLPKIQQLSRANFEF
ncbi:polysaccharide pyruvyl transferase family protein [Coleofasciculus sp. G1-WW12-02]|uniref:polysaccharide pyruvyl transferase family protein n=1 Tax=Coleofasciculus sp. G1-WW12-02 TaxID=3068483 RepID=UPI004062B25E